MGIFPIYWCICTYKMTVVQADFWVRLLPSCKILTWSMYLLLGIDYLLNAIFFSLGFIFRGTVDILTMHNTGPQLFLCIARFMQHEMCHKAWLFVTSAKNVMLSKLPSSEIKTRKYQRSPVYWHNIHIHESWEKITDEKKIKRIFSDWTMWSVPILRFPILHAPL